MTHIDARSVAMVKGMARKFINRDVPPSMRSRVQDDVTSDALLALVEADRTFDPDAHKGVPFTAYAATIVRYRMIDGLRALLGRQLTQSCRTHGTVMQLIESGRDPQYGDESTSERMDRHVGGDNDALAGEFVDRLAMEQFIRVITYYLRVQGTASERYVFAHRMLGETLKQIGAGLGVTESRACQIDRNISLRLRRLRLEYPR